jgi:hypothetical protein
MNSLPKFIASIAALIASLALLWIAFDLRKASSYGGLDLHVYVHNIGM